MAKEALRLWQNVINELISIHKSPGGQAAAQRTVLLGTLMQQLDSTPALPRATWKTLIIEQKVSLIPFWVCKQGAACSLRGACVDPL